MLPAVTVTPPDGKGQFEERGFNVVDIKYAVRENAFTHEIGHNYGSQHDRFQFEIEKAEVAPMFVPSIPGAHGFILPEVNVRTVMAYDTFCQETFGFSCPRIPRFSKPGPVPPWFSAGRRAGPADLCRQRLDVQSHCPCRGQLSPCPGPAMTQRPARVRLRLLALKSTGDWS